MRAMVCVWKWKKECGRALGTVSLMKGEKSQAAARDENPRGHPSPVMKVSDIQELKRLGDLDDAGATAGEALLTRQTALDAECAEVMHRRVK